MEATIQLEGDIAGAGIFRIIIGEFSHWQESCPVIRLLVEKGPEVGLYCIILPLSLAVSLGVEGCRESSLDA